MSLGIWGKPCQFYQPWLGMVNIYTYTLIPPKKNGWWHSRFFADGIVLVFFKLISFDQRWCSHHAPGFAPPWLCLVLSANPGTFEVTIAGNRWIWVLQMIGPLVHCLVLEKTWFEHMNLEKCGLEKDTARKKHRKKLLKLCVRILTIICCVWKWV